MWELSTPFVYMRWFLFTLGKSGGRAYIVNGLLMVATFFVARNVFGTCEGPSPRPQGYQHAEADASRPELQRREL